MNTPISVFTHLEKGTGRGCIDGARAIVEEREWKRTEKGSDVMQGRGSGSAELHGRYGRETMM